MALLRLGRLSVDHDKGREFLPLETRGREPPKGLVWDLEAVGMILL